MAKYILKRIGMAVLTLLVIIIILFLLLKLMPGSPFNNERLTDAQREVLEEKYGLGFEGFAEKVADCLV